MFWVRKKINGYRWDCLHLWAVSAPLQEVEKKTYDELPKEVADEWKFAFWKYVTAHGGPSIIEAGSARIAMIYLYPIGEVQWEHEAFACCENEPPDTINPSWIVLSVLSWNIREIRSWNSVGSTIGQLPVVRWYIIIVLNVLTSWPTRYFMRRGSFW